MLRRAIRLLPLGLAVLALCALTALPAAAQQPDGADDHLDLFERSLSRLSRTDAVVEQPGRTPKDCGELKVAVAIVDDADFVLSDANLNAGYNGTRLCLFSDRKWDSYFVVLINQKAIADWRRTKEELQPQLVNGGIDPCKVALWTSTDSAIKRALTLKDQEDAGRVCTPELFTHGEQSEVHGEESLRAVFEAAAKAEEVFGWQPTWPIRVHVYDDHRAFINGIWEEGGDTTVTPKSMEFVRGVSMILANDQFGFLIDQSAFDDEDGLRALISHEYAHIAQQGSMGCTCTMPFWAVEGGAEYFASLVVGPDQSNMVDRMREALKGQFSRRPPTLKSLNRKSTGTASYAAYSRGYAAFRFLAAAWGEGTFSSLHRDYPTGNVDRYLAGLSHITGMSLDDFDVALGQWLKEQADTLPVPEPGPNTQLQPGSLITRLETARPIGQGSVKATAVFTSSDPAAAIITDWRCTERQIKTELVLIRPDGQRFGSTKATLPQGCSENDAFILPLDIGTPGRTPRAYPGGWRVEVYADGALQGSATFTIER